MARQLDKNQYLFALIISGFIFISGVFVGFSIEQLQLTDINEMIGTVRTAEDVSRVNFLLTNKLPGNGCRVLLERNSQLIDDIGSLGDAIGKYEENKKFDTVDFTREKTRYTALYVEFWLRQQDLQKKCGSNETTILFFFSNDDCPRCKDQGIVLDYYKKNLKEKLLVIPIDTDLNMSTITLLKQAWNIEKLPSMIINENKTLQRFVPKAEMASILGF